MTRRDPVSDVVDALLAAKATTRCQDLIQQLEALGFEVRDGKKQGHKVVTHPRLRGFLSAGFTCGHGRNPEVKPVYVRQMVQVLRQYHTELLELLENPNEH